MPALLLYGDTEPTPAVRHEVAVAIGDPLLFAQLDGRSAEVLLLITEDGCETLTEYPYGLAAG